MKKTTIGIIGCGNISDAYFKGAARSALVQVKACADLHSEAARTKAAQYGVSAVDVERRLATEHINVSVMEAASAQLDFGERGLDEVVRSSVHYYNSDEEIDVLVDAVRRARTG